MNLKIYNIKELTDSRVLYDKNPPKLMLYIIAVVTVLLVLFLLGSNTSIKTEMVKGQGIITTQNKSPIVAAVTGAVVKVNVLEGKDVKSGDILLTLNPVDVNVKSEEYKIIAQKNGKLHLNTNITQGMVIKAGSVLGSITNKEEKLIIETSVVSSDRPKIHIGDEVEVAIAGLDQGEYGALEGRVLNIDEDATIDNQKGTVYFNVKVKLNKSYLKNKKGEKVNIILGMVAETSIIYKKTTYKDYFMEQIGI